MLVSRKLLVFFEILGALNGRVGFASFFCAVRDLLPRLVVFQQPEAGSRWVFGFLRSDGARAVVVLVLGRAVPAVWWCAQMQL